MALDYSQKRLLSRAMHSRSRRLQWWALGMSVIGVLISFVHLILLAKS
jgi:hypothetical protein